MKYVSITAFDIPDAWFRTLERIWQEGDIFPVKYGSEITETKKLNLSLQILHPESRPLIADKAPCDMKYVTNYVLQYLWAGDKTEGETYTYASRMRKPLDQIAEVVQRFSDEPYDRQVVLTIRRSFDIQKTIDGIKHEPPCLTILDLEIFNNELHTTGYFRSWDAYAGLPANLAGLQIFLEGIVTDINKKSGNNYRTGKMIFHCKNCHIYSRLYDVIKDVLISREDSRRMGRT